MTTKEQIAETLDQIAETKAVIKHYNELLLKEGDLQAEIEDQRAKIDKELSDVMAMENVSVKSLVSKVMGNKEQKLEKEREEYLAATLELKEMEEALDMIAFEKSVLVKKKGKLDQYLQQLDNLKKIRFNEIIKDPSDPNVSKLVDIMEDLDFQNLQMKEIGEAEKVLYQYQTILEEVYKLLREILYWIQQQQNGMQSRRAQNNKYEAINRVIYVYSKLEMLTPKVIKEVYDLEIKYEPKDINIEALRPQRGTFMRSLISDFLQINTVKTTQQQIHLKLSDTQKMVNIIEGIRMDVLNKLKNLESERDEVLTNN